MRKRSKLAINTGVPVPAFAFGGASARASRKAGAEAVICVSPDLFITHDRDPLELGALSFDLRILTPVNYVRKAPGK